MLPHMQPWGRVHQAQDIGKFLLCQKKNTQKHTKQSVVDRETNPYCYSLWEQQKYKKEIMQRRSIKELGHIGY